MSTRLIVVIDYFPICTNIKSLYYIPETNVSYISIKKKKNKKRVLLEKEVLTEEKVGDYIARLSSRKKSLVKD